MALLILRHVETNHRALVVEHEFRQRACELRLADSGRAEEDERADRTVRILEPGARAAQRVGNRLDRFLLPDHALVEALFHVDQLLGLAFEQLGDRNARPACDDGCDVVLVDLFVHHRVAGEAVAVGELLLELRQLAVADLRDALEVAGALFALCLALELVDAPGDLLHPLERLLLLAPARGERVAHVLCVCELQLDRLLH